MRKIFFPTAFLFLSLITLSCTRSGDSGSVVEDGTMKDAASGANTTSMDRRPEGAENVRNNYGTGIPDCEDYLSKYEACLTKVPEDKREDMRRIFQNKTEEWRDASIHQPRDTVARACRDAREAIRDEMKRYGCAW